MPWIDACDAEEVEMEDAIRFDRAGHSYALYLAEDGTVHCTDGFCPQDGAHLAGGLVEGSLVECPLHGGTFDIRTGQPQGDPACAPLATYPARIERGRVQLDLPA